MGIPSIYRFMNAVCTSVHGIARAAHVLKGTREVESEGAQEHNMNAALVLVVVCTYLKRGILQCSTTRSAVTDTLQKWEYRRIYYTYVIAIRMYV